MHPGRLTCRSMEACVRVLLGERPPARPAKGWALSSAGTVAIMNAMQVCVRWGLRDGPRVLRVRVSRSFPEVRMVWVANNSNHWHCPFIRLPALRVASNS